MPPWGRMKATRPRRLPHLRPGEFHDNHPAGSGASTFPNVSPDVSREIDWPAGILDVCRFFVAQRVRLGIHYESLNLMTTFLPVMV